MGKVRQSENLEKAKEKLAVLQMSAMASFDLISYQRAVERLNTLKDLNLLSSEEMEESYIVNDQIRVAIWNHNKLKS